MEPIEGYTLKMMKRDNARTFAQLHRYHMRAAWGSIKQSICRMYNRSMSSANTSILLGTGIAAPVTIAFA